MIVTLIPLGYSDDKSTNEECCSGDADYYPAWSPDGKAIAFFSEYVDDSAFLTDDWLRLIDLESRVIRDIWHVPDGLAVWDLTWSPDNQWLAFSSDVGIFKIHTSGDSLQQLTQGEFHRAPFWSKHSGRIHFVQPTHPHGGLFSVAADGTYLVRDIASDSGIAVFRGLRDSDTMLVGAYRQGGQCLLFCEPNSEWLGAPVLCELRLVDHLRTDSNADRIFFLGMPSGGSFSIYEFSRSGETMRKVIDGHSFDLSPSESLLVVADVVLPRRLSLFNLFTHQSCQLTKVTDTSKVCGVQ